MTSYYTLMTSLPRHSGQFSVKQTPISRIQLEKKVKLLTASEQHILYAIEMIIWKSWFDQTLSLNDIISQSKKILESDNNFISELIYWYLDLRSLLAALRLRKAQQPAPANPQDHWVTHWTARLINNWNKPDFGLKEVYPWLPDANARILNNEPDVLEETLLTQVWKHLKTIDSRHYFDFEAMIIYLLRWDIVNYWSQFNDEAAIKRLNDNVDHILSQINPMQEAKFDHKGSQS